MSDITELPNHVDRADRIDLRSDTVTKPCAAMREAMARAAVGDDVYGEDPTVNHLQEHVAELLGKEAALFVPSGCMANQIAINIHTRPGDEILVGNNAHNWLFESGAAPMLSGVQVTVLPGDGRFTGTAVRAAYKPDNHHMAPTTLIAVENTHNMGGGLVWDEVALRDVISTAGEFGLATHLDGARLWNAAIATGRSMVDLAAGFDTVSVCLSKGLGAPVGSLLCGTQELVHRAHRVRKIFGGAMRQAGILAAAGLYAIEHNHRRMAVDHENAARLAAGIEAISGLDVDKTAVHTNIVMVNIVDTGHHPAVTAPVLAELCKTRGLDIVPINLRRLRLVTHLDVDADQCDRAVEILAAAVIEVVHTAKWTERSRTQPGWNR